MTASQELISLTHLAEPPRQPRRIFVNRNLRLDSITAVGFDMDYTLARYRRERLERLGHQLTLEKLISSRGYPDDVRALKYDPRFVIRGLVVDKELGNILKLDRHRHVGRAYHGREPLTKERRHELYRTEKLVFAPPRFAQVDTLFSLPEMCLYADLVNYFDRHAHGSLNPWQIFDDVRECIDEAHRDGTLKSIVRTSIDTYIEQDDQLATTLHKMRSAGKRLFLLTNSFGSYTRAVMTYLLDGQLAEYSSWQSYFDVIIVGASKPGFFNGAEPFLELDEDDAATDKTATHLQKGKLYQGGNRKELERMMGVSGDEVLYVGDHIYGDILRSRKASLWRTALVVEELEEEIVHMENSDEVFRRLSELETRRRRLDEITNLQRQALSGLDKEDPHYSMLREQRDHAKRELKELNAEIDALEERVADTFNPYWGFVFKEQGELTRFGEQVAEYACIYTSRVSNFTGYSSYQYFRSARDLMPHERE
ncbi:MAG: HAD-IG family 5'-nucleotidase [Myxococcota bacterium]